ncbi:MAG: PIG-L family deacetylase [Clostridia bacterium]
MTKTYFSYDNTPIEKALEKTTHLAISAHQDDIEFMSYNAIAECFGKQDKWFSAIVLTNGSGSPRNGLYTDITDEKMQQLRILEQKKAAFIGEYASLSMLGYPSSEIKNSEENKSVIELANLIKKCNPEFMYTHNPADKHDTHVATAIKVIKAIRTLDKKDRPKKLYGCEVWRSLDWVCEEQKIQFDVSSHPNIANALLGVFDSQIAGGKRYDEATIGRRLANATYSDGHKVDSAKMVSYAIDMTPLIEDDNLTIELYMKNYLDNFTNDIMRKIQKYN